MDNPGFDIKESSLFLKRDGQDCTNSSHFWGTLIEKQKKWVFCGAIALFVALIASMLLAYFVFKTINVQTRLSVFDEKWGSKTSTVTSDSFHKQDLQTINFTFKLHGEQTTICYVGKNDHIFCLNKTCAKADTVTGHWAEGDRLAMENEEENILKLIKFGKGTFHANITIKIEVYHSADEEQGFVLYKNKNPWIQCRYYTRKKSSTGNSRWCKRNGRGQQYRLQNNSLVKSIITYHESDQKLLDADELSLKFFTKSGYLCDSPTMELTYDQFLNVQKLV